MDTCQQCGNEYKRIASHWSQSQSCSYPRFSDHQREIITGMLMGDGTINNSNTNPLLQCEMITPEYLEHIDSEFGIFGHGVTLSKTAEESAKENRDSGFSPNALAENYHNAYRWYSMNHPELHGFADWYETGHKLWPADIDLTPTVLKHWYCGDGHWHNSGTNNNIRIAMANEVDNTEKVSRLFENASLPAPSNYNIVERDSGGVRCSARFTVDQSKELWEYMGDPLPGFEYKWPSE